MGRYRKKPIEIEAIQYTGDFESLDECLRFVNSMKPASATFTVARDRPFLIRTKEGDMEVSVGDWIIKEPFPTSDRRFYPCKPDIFESTYDEVEELAAPRVCDKACNRALPTLVFSEVDVYSHSERHCPSDCEHREAAE